MENNTLEKEFHEILKSQDFERLVRFKNSECWNAMTPSERDLLGLLFVAQGENQLKKGDRKALDNFEIAAKIAPKNPLIFYRQALAFATQDHNMRCLESACKALQTVVNLDPTFFDAWFSWGKILVRMGIFHSETIYFQDAYLKFSEAYKNSYNATAQVLAECFWQWGLSSHYLGYLSGEACDFHAAIEKYHQAVEYGLQSADFWKDFGDATAELALLIGRKELIIEAIDRYRNVIKANDSDYNGWLGLARCFHRLFESDQDETYFSFANESYARAAELNPHHVDLWLYWGVLYSELGQQKRDAKAFEESLEKFAKADACEPNDSVVLSRWGEAQMLYGALLERGDLLREAESKIVRSLEIHSDNQVAWYLYGTCLNELGDYFFDEHYYLLAIEKFEYALTLNEDNPKLLYGLFLSHYALGDMFSDEEMIQKSLEYAGRVVQNGYPGFPQFWNDWGVALLKLGELTFNQKYVETAIEKFEKAINQHSEESRQECNLEWLYNYGCAFDFLGDHTESPNDYEKAVEILSKVIECDPSYTFARFNLALALSHLGDLIDDVESFLKSLHHFEILLTENPEDEATWNICGITLINFAQLLHDPLHPEESRKYFEQSEQKLLQAVALGSTSAFYNLACLYSLRGQLALAMNFIERAEMAGALPTIEALLHDEWLKNLRETAEFRHYLTLLNKKTQ